jgi:hypothetical protein
MDIYQIIIIERNVKKEAKLPVIDIKLKKIADDGAVTKKLEI